MNPNNPEEQFVRSFIEKGRQSRYLSFLSNPKKRAKILEKLSHGLDLDPRIKMLDVSGMPMSKIHSILTAKVASKSCHIIADTSDMDGTECEIDAALKFSNFHTFGAILAFDPARLVYYKTESPGPCYILEK